jgi:hypothetical protein
MDQKVSVPSAEIRRGKKSTRGIKIKEDLYVCLSTVSHFNTTISGKLRINENFPFFSSVLGALFLLRLF